MSKVMVWDKKNKKILYMPEKQYKLLQSFPLSLLDKYFEEMGEYIDYIEERR